MNEGYLQKYVLDRMENHLVCQDMMCASDPRLNSFKVSVPPFFQMPGKSCGFLVIVRIFISYFFSKEPQLYTFGHEHLLYQITQKWNISISIYVEIYSLLHHCASFDLL